MRIRTSAKPQLGVGRVDTWHSALECWTRELNRGGTDGVLRVIPHPNVWVNTDFLVCPRSTWHYSAPLEEGDATLNRYSARNVMALATSRTNSAAIVPGIARLDGLGRDTHGKPYAYCIG